jgi:hypothetical protein
MATIRSGGNIESSNMIMVVQSQPNKCRSSYPNSSGLWTRLFFPLLLIPSITLASTPTTEPLVRLPKSLIIDPHQSALRLAILECLEVEVPACEFEKPTSLVNEVFRLREGEKHTIQV